MKLIVKSKTSKKGISFVFTLVFTALLFNSQLNTALSNSTIKQQIEVLVRLMTVNCELVNHHLIPNSAVITENGRILQISVQHQHCENGLESFELR